MVSAMVPTATGVNADGHREVLGCAGSDQRERPGTGTSSLADLVARGLSGVRLVTSDAHTGLVEAIAANLPGPAWQRRGTHYAAKAMTTTLSPPGRRVRTLPAPSTVQADATAVVAQTDKCCAPGLMEAVMTGRITAHGTKEVADRAS